MRKSRFSEEQRNVSMTLRQLGSEFRLQSVRCGEASGLVEC